MSKKLKTLKEISIWALLLTSILHSFGFPVNKEIIPITEAVIQAAEQFESLSTGNDEELEVLHEFEEELETETEVETK